MAAVGLAMSIWASEMFTLAHCLGPWFARPLILSTRETKMAVLLHVARVLSRPVIPSSLAWLTAEKLELSGRRNECLHTEKEKPSRRQESGVFHAGCGVLLLLLTGCMSSNL